MLSNEQSHWSSTPNAWLCYTPPHTPPRPGVTPPQHAGEGEMAGRGLRQGSFGWGLQCLGVLHSHGPGCGGGQEGCQPPGAPQGALALLLRVFVGPGRTTRVRKHPKSSWCLSCEPAPAFCLRTAMCQEVA